MDKHLIETEKLYYELLWAVENKHPNESRHETALRLIQESQQSHRGSMQAYKDTQHEQS